MWRTSDIFVVQMKRLVLEGCITTLVQVPLGDMDFAPYFAENSPFTGDNNALYRLYAVINHAHNHYWTICRPDDGTTWMKFNDGHDVEEVAPAEVVTKETYVLFFRRVTAAPRTLESLKQSDERCQRVLSESQMDQMASMLNVVAATHDRGNSEQDGDRALGAGGSAGSHNRAGNLEHSATERRLQSGGTSARLPLSTKVEADDEVLEFQDDNEMSMKDRLAKVVLDTLADDEPIVAAP